MDLLLKPFSFRFSKSRRIKITSEFRVRHHTVILEGLELIQETPFFQGLDSPGKELLLDNAILILQGKRMVDENNKPLSIHKRFQIALVLAMGSLGLEEGNYYKKLNWVKVYPGTFFSPILGREVRGLSSVRGGLGLSWDDFIYGFKYNDDRYNLGLHEMAHLLMICGYVQITGVRDAWSILASQFIQKHSGKPKEDLGLFRLYALQNIEEFWACCVEQFYEMPKEFALQHPIIYKATKQKLGY